MWSFLACYYGRCGTRHIRCHGRQIPCRIVSSSVRYTLGSKGVTAVQCHNTKPASSLKTYLSNIGVDETNTLSVGSISAHVPLSCLCRAGLGQLGDLEYTLLPPTHVSLTLRVRKSSVLTPSMTSSKTTQSAKAPSWITPAVPSINPP